MLYRLFSTAQTTTHMHQFLNFYREGDKFPQARASPRNAPVISHQASNWEMQVDLKKSLVAPKEVDVTLLRLDMVLLSRSMKTILVVELTVSWEDKPAILHQWKKSQIPGPD